MAFTWIKSASNTFNNPVQTFAPTNGGDLLIWTAMTSIGGGSPIASVQDNTGTNWQIAVITSPDGKGQYRTIAFLPNCSPGITSVTGIYSGGGPGTIITSISEYQGIAAAAPLIGGAVSTSQTPGLGANAIIGGPLLVGGGIPALLFSAFTDYIGNGAALVAGAGFTSRGVFGAATLIQDQRILAPGTFSPTATDGTRGATDTYIGFTIAFAETAAGVLVPGGLVYVMP